VPRDSRVDVPGHGLMKITEAMSAGGPQLTAQAVSEWMGVPITYTIVTDFDGLSAMVDEFGGITVDVPERMDDSFTQVDLDPGPVPMDGDLALRFARSRHITGSDYQRTQNQALLILSALGEVRAAGTSPADTVRYLGILARHASLEGMSTADLYRLARVAVTIDPANVKSVLVPSSGALIGGTSYVIPTADAAGLFAAFADDAILEAH
jgi:polyisoprenyl-teichoic acid--peptidoglycan teichoic acid transferase